MNWSEAMSRFDEGSFGIICTNYADAINLFERIRTMTDRRPDSTLRNDPSWALGNYSYVAYYCSEDYNDEVYHGSADDGILSLTNRVKERCYNGVIKYSEIQDITFNKDEFLDILFQGVE